LGGFSLNIFPNLFHIIGALLGQQWGPGKNWETLRRRPWELSLKLRGALYKRPWGPLGVQKFAQTKFP